MHRTLMPKLATSKPHHKKKNLSFSLLINHSWSPTNTFKANHKNKVLIFNKVSETINKQYQTQNPKNLGMCPYLKTPP